MRKFQCLAVAVLLMTFIGCATMEESAVNGATLGAMTGAIIGHQSGETGPGAVIGAGVGALLGVLAHDYTDHVEQRAVAEYRAREYVPAWRYDHRGGTRYVYGSYRHAKQRAWVDTSHDERVWVPEHYAGGRRIEGHYETKHITDGYWKTVR
jgi:hypothetical protein